MLDRDPADLTGAAATQWRVLDAMGVTATAFPDDPGLVVDALVGYGPPDVVYERAGVDAVRPFGDGWRVSLTSS